jgi:hypothetical protein
MKNKLLIKASVVVVLGIMALVSPQRGMAATSAMSSLCYSGCEMNCNPGGVDDVCDANCPGWATGSCFHADPPCTLPEMYFQCHKRLQ